MGIDKTLVAAHPEPASPGPWAQVGFGFGRTEWPRLAFGNVICFSGHVPNWPSGYLQSPYAVLSPKNIILESSTPLSPLLCAHVKMINLGRGISTHKVIVFFLNGIKCNPLFWVFFLCVFLFLFLNSTESVNCVYAFTLNQEF